MATLPPLQMMRPKLMSIASAKLPCSNNVRSMPRSQLIKEKDDIDHYLEMSFKGLSKEEVAVYRNSYKKNICVDLLRDGYLNAFIELFGLIEKWESMRLIAKEKETFWPQKPLEDQPEKLDHLYYHLTKAEEAGRKKSPEHVYDNLYALACYFNNNEDTWVRNHFFERCFQVAKEIKLDGGRKEAEAHRNMAFLYEEEGQLHEATEHYEAFHQLTQGRMWKDETGRSLNLLACESLLRTLRLLADKMLENKEYKQAIKILIKASEIAKEGNDKTMEGQAYYYLGLAHSAAGEFETSLQALNNFRSISTYLQDKPSLTKAYEAIAKVLQSQGKMTEAIKYLKKLLKIARNNFQNLDIVKASMMLGEIYNEKGEYNKATEYFQQAFKTTAELTNATMMDETKVHYGIAKAHKMMLNVTNYIEAADHNSLECLLSWKENRSDAVPSFNAAHLFIDT
ncbi:tetratricopeptide repeat protein 29 [Sorex fumeus]|uniref:tetratricopeptide repeat protein 29 n=1 Tax=Sorex fumeus TaxID=62283 RepID=UPI0024AD40C8|nr:tetratricopeptide repeat protein 29 [Sorex fumeus]